MNDEILISLVQRHEELFNMNHKKYSDNVTKESIWRMIGQELGQTGTACKTRWFNLRDQFRRAIKNKKTKSGQTAAKRKKWKFEDEMSFLYPYFQERETLTSVNYVDENSNNSAEAGDKLEKSNDLDNNTKKEQMGLQVDHSIKESAPIIPPAPSKIINRKFSDPQFTVLKKYIPDKKEEIVNPKDPVDMFFSCMAETVKTFTPYCQSIAKSRVFAIISQLEMEQIMNKNSHLSTFQSNQFYSPFSHNASYIFDVDAHLRASTSYDLRNASEFVRKSSLSQIGHSNPRQISLSPPDLSDDRTQVNKNNVHTLNLVQTPSFSLENHAQPIHESESSNSSCQEFFSDIHS